MDYEIKCFLKSESYSLKNNRNAIMESQEPKL